VPQQYIPKQNNDPLMSSINKENNLLVLSGFAKNVLVKNSAAFSKDTLLNVSEISYTEINNSVKRQLQQMGYKNIQIQMLDDSDTLVSGNNLTPLSKQQMQLNTAPTLTVAAQQALTAAIKNNKKVDEIILITPQSNEPTSIQINCTNKFEAQATLFAKIYVINAQTLQIQSYTDTTAAYKLTSAETVCSDYDTVTASTVDMLLEPQMAKFEKGLGETVALLL